jgi:putative transcriptional regulator
MIEHMSSLAPCLLVASPLLLDPNFLHAVVLLIEHDENGAMGIILNRALPLTLEKICAESHLTYSGNDEDTAWRGGPVDPQRGIILVRGGLPAEDDTVLDFTDFVSFRKELLESLLLEPEATYRLYLGYAGWGAGQLEAEMEQGAWAPLPLSSGWLFTGDAKDLWQKAIQSLTD